ncbi:MAG: exopolysaccharide biosynthesis polyprenyl glycosylphosphotransferase [candidate division KSB1 bacterium]|nr:exopolysaccharide biosynthesis polyprenyl glycosylphosphotransferase [candidate division KSB1 bacterium]MDZ7274369.1 exopolysaccharide biosynthesis polyprenyl glycosylphosphotransferase [candidate division KSB1 bacterium]MDZ7284969.1 exopolysaccharide biosynthesis polyprenyl glycosylphosphotransferase [candidate division KSB1 bacterium]MDZ7297610.1 exopolysaccharide biosynthesis polyprenyl glycosylphosphotransferase [candidate division KSB1 bacterium]MDZ7306350.1 exopolysaccharide biosynthes
MALPSPDQQSAAVPAREETLPQVAIVIPLRGATQYLPECLSSIARQTYPPHLIEILIIADAPDEAAQKVIRAFARDNPGLRVRRTYAKSRTARSRRAAAPPGDVVIPLAPNAVLADDFIAQSIAVMQASGSAAVGGRLCYRGTGWLQQAAGMALASKWVLPTGTQEETHSGVRREALIHGAYRRTALSAAGVLEHEMPGHEYDTAARMQQHGYSLYFSPRIQSTLAIRADLFDLLGWTGVHGHGWAMRTKRTGTPVRMHHLLPALLLLVVATLALLTPLADWATTGLLAAGVIYAAGNLTLATLLALRSRLRYLPLLPVVLAVIHLGFGMGTLAGLLVSKRWGAALPKWVEKSAVILSDYVAITAAFFVWAHLRSELGLFAILDFEHAFFLANLIFVFWFLVFLLFGLYGAWNAASRLDESLAIVKIVGGGVLLIFLLTFDWERDLPNPISRGRMLLVSYWLIVAGAVITGRMLLRTTQRRLLENGIGLHRTVIVGWGQKARELYQNISKYPALGYRVIGFVAPTESDRLHRFHGVPVLGVLDRLGDIVVRHQVEDILIALQKQDQDALVKIIAQTDGLPVSLKIVPDLYSIITGQARTNQIYGFPLIEILPQYMPAWERLAKRATDVLVSLLVLVLGLPLWLLIALAIRLDSPGSTFYRQERVGKHGRIFEVIKFRSMVTNAEQLTGPKWAEKDDPRITRVGRFLRKWRLDEVPQFLNVLRGEMSIVGPRPERPYFVEKLRKEIPLYPRRLRVRPGITGWAQIKGAYDATLEDVKQKLQYDLFYLENMSLRMDLKIILHTIYVMLAGRGQ